MRIRIGSRKSDLARLQAALVARALANSVPSVDIEYVFKSAEGDRDKTTPLWQLPEKGVFTRDLSVLLEDGAIDIAVHSWKDLPLQGELNTEILGALPRADARDAVFIRKDRWDSCLASSSVRILSSSPRRAHNLAPFLGWALPGKIDQVLFEPVRGNIQTRIKKLLSGECDGLVVAKAALDRLLETSEPEYSDAHEAACLLLGSCRWMITPLGENPCAAAQGALAIEGSSRRKDLTEIISKISCARTMREAGREREILGGFGGGCHQKIGASVLERDFGAVISIRGITDGGHVLSERRLEAVSLRPPRAPSENIWPASEEDRMFFERRPRDVPPPAFDNAAIWVSRANALPSEWALAPSTVIWAAGNETWKKLAQRGVWVNGSAEGLGEDEPRGLDAFAPGIKWYKLSHSGAPAGASMELLQTYELLPAAEIPNLEGKTHFFWRSASQAEYVMTKYPSIRDLWHSTGPGNTCKGLKALVGDGRLSVFLDFEEWKREVLEQ